MLYNQSLFIRFLSDYTLEEWKHWTESVVEIGDYDGAGGDDNDDDDQGNNVSDDN